MAALIAPLRRLEPFDVVVGVHLRTGYADWVAARNADSSFISEEKFDEGVSIEQHWLQLEAYLEDCKRGMDGPCFNWEQPHFGRKSTLDDGRRCLADVSKSQRTA